MKSVSIFVLMFLLTIPAVAEETSENMFDIGAGLGGAYGFIGLNADVCVIPNLNLFAGLGIGPAEKPQLSSEDRIENKIRWSVGIRYHFLNFDNNIRPRITVYYGINSYLEHIRKFNDGTLLGTFKAWGHGASVGGGFKWMFGKSKNIGFDFDLYYALSSDSFIDKDEIDKYYPISEKNKFYFSLGLRYAFDF